MNVESLRASLDFAGFNLFAVLDINNVDNSSLPAEFESLLLIGSAGVDLWQKMPTAYRGRQNPVDEYSIDSVENLIHQQLPDGDWKFLYPDKSAGPLPNLQRLGRIAGWHHDSPLGSGINQTHGLWFAYRAVVAVARPLTVCVTPATESPCVSCADAPCVSACPAKALAIGHVPDLGSCVQYRTSDDSTCARSCLARLSCPVASQWRYSDEQINYFYGRSLLSLREWVASNSGLSGSD